MKFVNLKPKTVHTKFTGFIQPGKAVEGNRSSQRFAQVLEEIVGSCGQMIGIKLTPYEETLVDKILNLHKLGSEFSPDSIPEGIRNDPTGVKRAAERSRMAQQAAMDKDKNVNQESRKREALINGEIQERRPKGLNSMDGVEVDPSMLKSGFEAILEENARIAEREKDDKKKKEQLTSADILDPIGALAKKDPGPDRPADVVSGQDGSTVMPKHAIHREDDGTRSADAVEPVPQTSERAGAMDKGAADMARKLSTFSAFSDVPKPKQPEPKPPAPKPDPESPKAAKAPKAKGKGKKSKAEVTNG